MTSACVRKRLLHSCHRLCHLCRFWEGWQWPTCTTLLFEYNTIKPFLIYVLIQPSTSDESQPLSTSSSGILQEDFWDEKKIN